MTRRLRIGDDIGAGKLNYRVMILRYQNLVSMVFALMGFRDAWMKIGKAGTRAASTSSPEPLHLVLVEEPEAYQPHLWTRSPREEHGYQLC